MPWFSSEADLIVLSDDSVVVVGDLKKTVPIKRLYVKFINNQDSDTLRKLSTSCIFK